jgi:hypothetical protein
LLRKEATYREKIIESRKGRLFINGNSKNVFEKSQVEDRNPSNI